jgi:hypothetical protein
MLDALFLLSTLAAFGIAYLYVEACDKLKVKPKP